MYSFPPTFWRRAAVPLAALALAACGGGSSSGPPESTVQTPSTPPVTTLVTGTEVPVAATATSAAATAYVAGLANSADNTAEPVVVGDAVLATSDTDEPDATVVPPT